MFWKESRMHIKPGNGYGIPSGFIDLDYKLSGFQPSDFILIAARTFYGFKTAFVLNVVDYVSVRKNLALYGIQSWKCSKEQLVNRIAFPWSPI